MADEKDNDKYIQPVEAIVSDPEFLIEGLPAGVLSLAKQMILDGTPKEEVVNLLANQLTYEASKEREVTPEEERDDSEFEASLAEEEEESPSTSEAEEVEEQPTEKPEPVNEKQALADLYKWKKVAMRLFKEGKPQREFQSDLLPADVQKFVQEGLGNCLDQKSLSKLFVSAAYLLK